MEGIVPRKVAAVVLFALLQHLSPKPATPDSPDATSVQIALSPLELWVTGCEQKFCALTFKQVALTPADSASP